MDVFQQNWTQRMHNEPFVNYQLQTYHPTMKKKLKGWRYMRKYDINQRKKHRLNIEVDGENFRPAFAKLLTNKDNYKQVQERVKNYPPGMKKIAPQYKKESISKPPGLYEYTRPQSLYNLHYPSLR